MYGNKLKITFTGYKTTPSNIELGVYLIKHKLTNKIYVGSTYNSHIRLNEHSRDLSNQEHPNNLLQDCANIDGEFEISFYKQKNIDEAIILEQKIIDESNKDDLLNITYSSTFDPKEFSKNKRISKKMSDAKLGNINGLGYIFTDEQRIKHSDRLLGNTYRKDILHTDETRRKMSIIKKGVSQSQEVIDKSAAKRTVWNVKIDDKLYLNAAEASRASGLGLSDSGIIRRCKSSNFPNYELIKVNKEIGDSKICDGVGGCMLTKPLSEFRKNTVQNRYFAICRECERKNKKEYRNHLTEITYEDKEPYRIKQTGNLKKIFIDNLEIQDIPNIKKCSKKSCQKITNIFNFPYSTHSPDGHGGVCLDCVNKTYESRKKYSPTDIKEKQCLGECGLIKPISYYTKSPINKDGYKNICKECSNKKRDEYILNGEQSIFLKRKSDLLCNRFNIKINDELYKHCSRCEQPKKINDFRKDSSSADGYSSLCKTHLSRNQSDLFESAKVTCNNILNMALKAGLILKPNACECCGDTTLRIEGHHYDYTKPMGVMWLCVSCHSDWHYKHKFIKIIMFPDESVEEKATELKIVYENYFVLYNENIIKYVVFVIRQNNYS